MVYFHGYGYIYIYIYIYIYVCVCVCVCVCVYIMENTLGEEVKVLNNNYRLFLFILYCILWHNLHCSAATLSTACICPNLLHYRMRTRGGTVVRVLCCKPLVQFQMMSLKFFVAITLPIALWFWGRLSL